MPKISVIVTTKNRVKFLCEAIDSFLKQTLAPFEILVIDDQSTDGTEGIVRERFGTDIKYFRNKKGGAAAGRNVGFANACGDYIKLFDDDDVLSSNSLEAQWKELTNSKRRFVYSPYIKARLENEKWQATDCLMHYYPLRKNVSIRQFMIRGGFLVLPSCLFHRSLIDKVGPFNESLNTYEDWEFLWRLGAHEKFPAHTRESIMIYRQHGVQLTDGTTTQDRMSRNKVEATEMAFRCLNDREAGFSWLDRWFLTRNKFEALKYLPDADCRSMMLRDLPAAYTFINLVYRGLNKWERIITKTNWTRNHGVTIDHDIIERYLSVFNGVQRFPIHTSFS